MVLVMRVLVSLPPPLNRPSAHQICYSPLAPERMQALGSLRSEYSLSYALRHHSYENYPKHFLHSFEANSKPGIRSRKSPVQDRYQANQ
jgi:hypothetical protein